MTFGKGSKRLTCIYNRPVFCSNEARKMNKRWWNTILDRHQISNTQTPQRAIHILVNPLLRIKLNILCVGTHSRILKCVNIPPINTL